MGALTLLTAVLVLILSFVLILVLALVLILVLGAVFVLILVVHFSILQFVCVRLCRYHSLPVSSRFILSLENQTGE